MATIPTKRRHASCRGKPTGEFYPALRLMSVSGATSDDTVILQSHQSTTLTLSGPLIVI
jgi:hypothetical protein